MHKKVLALSLVLILGVFSMAGCSRNVTGNIGRTNSTLWFDFTVNSVEKVDSYAEYVPADGYQLYDVDVVVKNTFDEAIVMGTFDFYMDDPSFEEYIWPLDPMDSTMMPLEYSLEPGETAQYHMVFEIPADATELVILYTEFSEADEEGKTFIINVD